MSGDQKSKDEELNARLPNAGRDTTGFMPVVIQFRPTCASTSVCRAAQPREEMQGRSV